MNLTLIIGIMASAGTSLSLLPQLIKLIRERKAEDLSIATLSVLAAGLSLWVFYGIRIEDIVIIISNTVALIITIITAALTLIYKR